MAWSAKTTLEAILSYAAASGYFRQSRIGEFTSPPVGESGAVFSSIYMRTMAIGRLYLNGGTDELHTVAFRIVGNALHDSPDEMEFAIAEAAEKVLEDILGEYDLGTTIREVDAAGMHGTPVRIDWGHIEIAKTMFRVADITLPLSVDDSITMAA